MLSFRSHCIVHNQYHVEQKERQMLVCLLIMLEIQSNSCSLQNRHFIDFNQNAGRRICTFFAHTYNCELS
jgi:hypothetical protein